MFMRMYVRAQDSRLVAHVYPLGEPVVVRAKRPGALGRRPRCPLSSFAVRQPVSAQLRPR